jgi:hypothetical protein
VRSLVLTSALTAALGFSLPTPAEARKDRSRMDKTERKVLRAINKIRASTASAGSTAAGV